MSTEFMTLAELRDRFMRQSQRASYYTLTAGNDPALMQQARAYRLRARALHMLLAGTAAKEPEA